MAFMLLTGAGLLLQAFLNLQKKPTGLVAEKVLTLHLSIALQNYRVRGSYDRYLRQLEERIIALPGVRAVGFVQFLPFQNWGWLSSSGELFMQLLNDGIIEMGRAARRGVV